MEAGGRRRLQTYLPTCCVCNDMLTTVVLLERMLQLTVSQLQLQPQSMSPTNPVHPPLT